MAGWVGDTGRKKTKRNDHILDSNQNAQVTKPCKETIRIGLVAVDVGRSVGSALKWKFFSVGLSAEPGWPHY